MNSKITWTHVDAHVRRHCEQAGVLELGATDAEVAYNYLKYVESRAALYQRKLQNAQDERDRLKAQLRALEAEPAKVGKTKQRLAALEKAVAELQSREFSQTAVAGATHEWSISGQMARRSGDGWAIWQNEEWLWIGSEFKGEMVPLADPTKADPFGPRDADGWYTWNGDDTIRPVGKVEVVLRGSPNAPLVSRVSQDLDWTHSTHVGDVVKWRPAQ